MIEKSRQAYDKHGELIRYGIMAVLVVSVEYGSYLLLLIVMSYLLAVPVSMLLGIILNWYFSHKFVFNNRRHAPRKEFALVFLASLVGVGLQLTTAYIAVTVFLLSAAVAKLFAIVITFFWNYYFRKKYVF